MTTEKNFQFKPQRIFTLMLDYPLLTILVGATLIFVYLAFQDFKDDDRYDMAKAPQVLARGDVALISVAPDGTPLWGTELPNGEIVYFSGHEALKD